MIPDIAENRSLSGGNRGHVPPERPVTFLRNSRSRSGGIGGQNRPEYSSGGKSQLGCISRRGDSYVRRILIQGAHSILKRIDTQDGRRGQWLRDLVARRGKQVAAVALANKNARIAWRLLRHEVPFDEDHALAA